MKKRNYTHVQALLPEIKAMLAEGKTQREVAEHYGFQDKMLPSPLQSTLVFFSLYQNMGTIRRMFNGCRLGTAQFCPLVISKA
ncbi:hypothetical protein [Gemmiger sp. An120]|uniref:hypothetical protein n=1 Tax=Gemmiger sp. An120 TaxID=1965549 RepID=UPI0019CFAE64|nr:hypothetical protein [Gemmiger sp. An120]